MSNDMKQPPKATAIQCTSCHAPLEVLGSAARSKVLVCGYCGMAMDSKNEFRALYAYIQVIKPSCHLSIGMRAPINGVEFTITAFSVYEALQGSDGEWVEYQLYAPNYGYALLIMRGDRDCYFLRKTYHLPSPNIWLLRAGDGFVAKQTNYTIDAFHLTRVLYREGVLLDNMKQDKRDKQCFASAGEQCYYSKYSVNKVNYFQGYSLERSALVTLLQSSKEA